jgi:hypothetical protein
MRSLAKGVGAMLRRHFRSVVAVGLAATLLGILELIDPLRLLLLRSGGLAVNTFCLGVGITMVGLLAGFRRLPMWLVGIGVTLGAAVLLGGLALTLLGAALKTTVLRTTTVTGPRSVLLIVRTESPVSDQCFSVELA